MTTRTERDEAGQTWAETSHHSHRDAAEEAGYEPHRDDLLRGQPLDPNDPWMVALRASTEEANRLREQA